jgi:hypothetical protein
MKGFTGKTKKNLMSLPFIKKKKSFYYLFILVDFTTAQVYIIIRARKYNYLLTLL